MSPEEVLASMLNTTEAEFRARLDTMSEEEAAETDKSLDKVNMLMMLGQLTNAAHPQAFVDLAESMGLKDVAAILHQAKDGTVLSTHKHRCPDCNTVFQHNPWHIEDHDAAHTCPKEDCRKLVSKIYAGDETPAVLHHGETV